MPVCDSRVPPMSSRDAPRTRVHQGVGATSLSSQRRASARYV
nr:hypothetical protein [Sorangium cellulosum]